MTQIKVYDENPLLFTDLLYSFDISHQDTGYWGHWQGKHEVINIAELNEIFQAGNCNLSDFVTVPIIYGELYLLLKRLDFDNAADED